LCQRVYAIKVLLSSESKASAALAYWPVPLYGSTDQERPIELAVEKEQLPEVVSGTPEDLPQDDDLDDKKIEINPVNPVTLEATPGLGSGGPVVVDANLLATLNALNDNMKRMADAFDALNNNVSRIADSFEKFLVSKQ